MTRLGGHQHLLDADRDLAQHLAPLNRAALDVVDCTLRANGAALTPAVRDEMLARVAANQYVELELDLLAYEQKAGESNRNFVRFRDGALLALGRTGAGKPFLRDHRQNDALARGGSIVSSTTEKRGEGDYAIRQTVKLTAGWAVDLALRGLLTTVSIGWNPTGDTLCSVCNAAIFTKCYHWPGDRLKWTESESGEKRLVRDRAGDLTVEWIYTAAELVETSAVSVPAVPSAHIETIRAALSAAWPQLSTLHKDDMTDPKLLALLKLAATAGDAEVLKAVETILHEAETTKADLKIANTDLEAANAKLSVFETAKKKSDEDEFIRAGIASGRIAPGDDEALVRELYALSIEKATERVNKRKAGSATPVGSPRQSGGTLPVDPPVPGANPHLSIAEGEIRRLGGDPDKVRAQLRAAGFSAERVEKMLADYIGGGKAA